MKWTVAQKREYQKQWRKKNSRYNAEAQRLWRQEHPESSRRIQRKCRLKRDYGITDEIYDALLKKQNHCCGICKTPVSDVLHIDHCHTSKKVRGLLCGNCNRGLGFFKDNITFLWEAIKYLGANH